MYILRSMFVISGSSLYPGFIIERFNCSMYHVLVCTSMYTRTYVAMVYVHKQGSSNAYTVDPPSGGLSEIRTQYR